MCLWGPCRPPKIPLAHSHLGPFLKLLPWAGTRWCLAHPLGLSYAHWSLMATDLNKAKEIARDIQFETQSKTFIWNHNTFYGLCHYPVKKNQISFNVAYTVKHKYPNYSTPINVGSGESTQTWLGENTFPTLQLLRTFKCHAQKGNVVCGQNHMYDDDGKQGGFPMVLAMLLSTLTG